MKFEKMEVDFEEWTKILTMILVMLVSVVLSEHDTDHTEKFVLYSEIH